MAWVIGTSRAHAILRSVHDDFMLNFGVYAISFFPPLNAEKATENPGSLLVK